jgi:hypothetical protein
MAVISKARLGSWRHLLRIAVLGAALLAALLSSAGQSGEANRRPSLDSALEQLVADHESGRPPDRDEAAQRGIELEGDRVRVIVEADESAAPDVPEKTVQAGGIIEGTVGALVQAQVPIGELRKLAREDGVVGVRLPMRPYVDVTSEGVALIQGNTWQSLGLTGAGVKVAVLDLGFQGYEAKLGTELPASVTAMSFVAGGDIHGGGQVHGTGVAEVVHDMAPDAELYFANFSTEVELASATAWLTSQGVDVVNASWGFFASGPGDGTGIVNQIIADSVNAGAFWSVAAGNMRNRHWSGTFVDTDGDGYSEFAQSPFDEGNKLIGGGPDGRVQTGQKIIAELKWDDPFGASCRDYDLYLVRVLPNGAQSTVAGSENIQHDGTQCISGSDPVEAIQYGVTVSASYFLAVRKFHAESAATFHLFSAYQNLTYTTPENSLLQPADSPLVTTVGAVPQSSPTTIEPFSSLGPTTDGRTKPDIAGPDGVANSTYGLFYGTSAAAPHIAGAAALILGVQPCLSPADVRAALEASTVDLGDPGKDTTFGSGLLVLGDVPVDADADGVALPCDNCPAWANPSQGMPDWTIPAGDLDCDGFPDSAAVFPRASEAQIGTVATQHCAATPQVHDEPLPDAWPPDFNDNQLVNAGDLLAFNPVFGLRPSDDGWSPRYDLNGSLLINVSDVLQLNPFMFKRCN